MREPHACQAKNSERMLFFEPIYSSLFLKFAIPVLKTLSLSLPTAPKRAKSVEVGLAEELTALGGVPLVVRAFRSLGLPAAIQEHVHIKQRERKSVV